MLDGRLRKNPYCSNFAKQLYVYAVPEGAGGQDNPLTVSDCDTGRPPASFFITKMWSASNNRVRRKDTSGMQRGPDLGQMVVVVFGHKIEMIDQAKRLLETRMQQRLKEHGVVQPVQFCYQSRSSGSKFLK